MGSRKYASMRRGSTMCDQDADTVRPIDTETPETLSIEDTVTEILNTDTPPGLERRTRIVFEEHPYITTILYSLESWLRAECEDERGATMVHELMVRFARHEAERSTQ